MSTDLPPPAAPAPAPAPAPVPAKKSNTLVIVLCVVFGVLLLILASCVGTCIYVGKKAKDYSDESKKNPQISALSLMAAVAPGIEVVAKDLDAGTITLKNTKTGEIVKLNARDLSEDKLGAIIESVARGKGVSTSTTPTATPPDPTPAPAEPASPPSATEALALNSTVKSFSGDFPVYSGGNVTTLDAAQESFAGVSTTRHTFQTSDAPDKVAAFYVKKLEASGYSLLASDNSTDDNGAKLMRVFQKGGMGSTINVEVRVEDGKTHAEVNQVMLKQP